MKKHYSFKDQLPTLRTSITACLLMVFLGAEKFAFSNSIGTSDKKVFLRESNAIPLPSSEDNNSSSGSIEITNGKSKMEGKKLASRGGFEKNPASAFSQTSDKNSSFGKEDDNGPTQVGDTMILERSRTNIDFSESLIEGKMKAPSGFFIQARKGQKLTNLIKLRASFRPEMLKSRGLMSEASNQ